MGTTGAGKTVLARQLASLLQLPHVEVDALFHGPDWTPAPPEVFRERIGAAVAADGFVLDGNYGVVRDIVWPRLDTLVWLDYRRALIMARVLRRTLRRIVTREELWNGNRERWRSAFLSRDSILLWAWRSHARKQVEYPRYIRQYGVPNVIRLRSPAETEAWLASLYASTPASVAEGRATQT